MSSGSCENDELPSRIASDAYDGNGGSDSSKLRLCETVKKDVKQIMELVVTCKQIGRETACVRKFCISVENCVQFGLRRKILGLLKTKSSTVALLHKIAKHCPEAAYVVTKTANSWLRNDKTSSTLASLSFGTEYSPKTKSSVELSRRKSYFWIEVALFEKKLIAILEYLIANSSKFYESDSIVGDPEFGTILLSLLVGPCSLTYCSSRNLAERVSTAEELVERNRLTFTLRKKPKIIADLGTLPLSAATKVHQQQQIQEKIEYIDSLHQNANSDLIYGKNNILINCSVNKEKLVAGYLSLHKIHPQKYRNHRHHDQQPDNYEKLVLRWTANKLMLINSRDAELTAAAAAAAATKPNQDPVLDLCSANNSFEININDIIYIHCHKNEIDDADDLINILESKVILVGKDGVQRPPINFSQTCNMVTFLQCLETGLLPYGRLDPPIRTQNDLAIGQFTCNYNVFKIIRNSILNEEIKRKNSDFCSLSKNASVISTSSIAASTMTATSSQSSTSTATAATGTASAETPQTKMIGVFCSSINQNILNRAFNGWLTYCRHLSTIRQHLSQLVHKKSAAKQLQQSLKGVKLSEKLWLEFKQKRLTLDDIYAIIYYNGIEETFRAKIWPYLLGVYDWSVDEDAQTKIYAEQKCSYETKMIEWLAVEEMLTKRSDNSQDSKSSFSSISFDSVDEDKIRNFALNLQHIDKDVHRCDRSFYYFCVDKNLKKLRNVIVTYIWENLEIGYMQGFVDILAPLLVVFDDETVTFLCFKQLMKRLIRLFPAMGSDMDLSLINLKSMVQMFDSQVYSLIMDQRKRDLDTDYGLRFFFSYRWFLLNFKREFTYAGTFRVWECIWAADSTSTNSFALFVAVALVEVYRGIILTNKMDFTEIMKFFNGNGNEKRG